ncbi:MAG: hypothetical protein ACREHD_24360 [Pirellulales bacterium]
MSQLAPTAKIRDHFQTLGNGARRYRRAIRAQAGDTEVVRKSKAKGVERAMQSSAVVALRTMTMIVCLVAVPLVAVLGTTLPKVVKSAFGHREAQQKSHDEDAAAIPDRRDLTSAATELVADEPMPSRTADAKNADHESAVPRVRITGVRALDEAPLTASEDLAEQPPIETAPLWNPSPRTASAPRGRPMTTHFVPSPLPPQASQPRRRGDVDAGPPYYDVRVRGESLQKTVYSQPDETATHPTTDDENDVGQALAGERMAPVQRVANTGALADGEQRLRGLGATYYRLEAWGSDGSFYRCSCSVPLTPRSRATRHFESIGAAPSQAIDAVIKQVETWRAKRVLR